jgi:hypothetical protein
MKTARGGIQRRIQTERSVPLIFKFMAFDAAGGKRQNRIESIKSLNCCFLINTEYGGMLRRIQIQPDNVRGLSLEVRIIADQIPLSRCGFSPASFQTRWTACLLTPSSTASLRQLQ